MHHVRAGESLQAAVDAARPGDTIQVGPGVYSAPPGARAVVTVNTHELTLVGNLGAVIDAAGADFGLLAGADRDPRREGCPAHAAVQGLRLRGFTFTRAARAGVHLVGVERYRASHGFYIDNARHAVAAICSRDGRLDHNLASRHGGAAVDVSNGLTLRIDHNVLTHDGTGVAVQNSLNVVIRENWITNNGAGVLVAARPNHPVPTVENVSIERNWIVENNRPAPDGDVPLGTGILILGGDDVAVRENSVIDNASLGIAALANPWADLDPRIEPYVDGLRVRGNIVKHNGRSPDATRLTTPAADVVFVPDLSDAGAAGGRSLDPDPGDNCFADNHVDTEVPAGVTTRFRCP